MLIVPLLQPTGQSVRFREQRLGSDLALAYRAAVTRRRVEMHVPRSLRSSRPLCSNCRSLARVGEPDRCEFHAFLPAGSSASLPAR